MTRIRSRTILINIMRVLYKVKKIYLNKEKIKDIQNNKNFKESLKNRLIRRKAQKS